MIWRSWYRRLLEPVGGDRLGHPARMLRLNLRRVELVAYVGIFDAAVEGFLGLFLRNSGLMTVYVIAIAGCILFAFAGRRGQGQTDQALAYLPESFIVFILACSQAAGFFVALSGRIPSGYAMVFLAVAAVFLIPPKRFALIGFLSFVAFSMWVVAIDVSLRDKAVVLFTTGLSVIAGCFGRYGLYRMQLKYERQRERIAKQNVALLTANEQLRRQNDELNQIMAIAAHDLRSPLLGLNNLFDLAQARPPSSKAALQQMLSRANDSVLAMLDLVGRVLDAHEAEGRTMRLSTCDLRDVLQQASSRAWAMTNSSGIVFTTRVPDTPVMAVVDQGALGQAIDNLVSNAFRFAPAETEIELWLEHVGSPSIEMRDRGPGVSSAEQDTIFEKFARGSRRSLRGERGSGLGLYIARTLLHRMNAQLSYQPRLGGGSIFRIDLTSGRRL